MHEARQYLTPKDIDVVVYHKNCFDGSGSAFAAHHYFTTEKISPQSKSFIPLDYKDPIPYDSFQNKNVIVLDFSFKRLVFQEIQSQAKSLMVLDHHVTAEREIAGLEGVYIDKMRSGATLAWNYFFDTDIPYFLLLIEDRDLWRYRYGDKARHFYHGIKILFHGSNIFDYKLYEAFLDDKQLEHCLDIGRLEFENEQERLSDISRGFDFIASRLQGLGDVLYKVAVLGLEDIKDWNARSELSEIIYKNNAVDFVLVWIKSNEHDSLVRVSLRNNTELDVSQIAQHYGGGGHPSASGFELQGSPLKIFIDIKN